MSDAEQLKIALTAHALGQLAGQERTDIQRVLADPVAPEARRHVAEVRRLAESLRRSPEPFTAVPSAALRDHLQNLLAVTPALASQRDRLLRPSVGSPGARQWVKGILAGGLLVAVLLLITLSAPFAKRFPTSTEVASRAPALTARGQDLKKALDRDATVDALSLLPVPSPTTPILATDLASESIRKDTNSESQGALNNSAHQLGSQLANGPVPKDNSAVAKTTKSQPFATAPTQTKPSRLEKVPEPVSSQQIAQQKPSESGRESGKLARKAGGDAVASKQIAPRGEASALEASDSTQSPLDILLPLAQTFDNRKTLEEKSAGSAVQEKRGGFSDAPESRRRAAEGSGERYAHFMENSFLASVTQPLSTFSIDVDTASYAIVRRFLSSGNLPPSDAVRIEELVNYFPYDYPQPTGDAPFSVTMETAACPWRSGNLLLRVGLKGRQIDRRERPAGNLVFLIDVSGSMAENNKLPLVKQALGMLVEELTENDRVSIVTYAGDAGLKLPSTSGDQKQQILAAINGLSSGGSTHGSAGIELAYRQAAEHFITGGVNRVILATDGDLNVGVTSDTNLIELIQAKATGGTFLTVLGFGAGNLQDEKMEKLADNGNGLYAYIDGAREARKVLVEQLTGSTIAIAKDVKIQIEFNPAQIASYRLLGYENRLMAAAEFRDDRKDAGEIGAGHCVTALYELLPAAAAADAIQPEPLKYQAQTSEAPATQRPIPQPVAAASGELLTLKLRFKRPDGNTSQLEEFPLAKRGGTFENASTDLRFASAVAAFGMLLRQSNHSGTVTFAEVAKVASHALGPDVGGYRAEFLDLVRKAEGPLSNR
ncbi:MAG: von Willebrand factor type A domain-containing protein [Planctomycetia bacterium]|nr:von Willebrand factor type A domain-containing protein [Planctomycetia bacterium]